MASGKKSHTSNTLSISSEMRLQWYRQMCRIRAFEREIYEHNKKGLVPGTAHLYIGMEAIAVGSTAAMRDGDLLTSTHRGHGHSIARGLDLGRMMAEVLGRADGYCRGKGGSMHITDVSRGMLGADGIVGGGIPIAAGAALGMRLKGIPSVVFCFFGDGASNQGSFHEALNFAAVNRLAVVFICENNLWALSTSFKETTAGGSVANRAAAYGMPGQRMDGNDVEAVFAAASAAAARAPRRRGTIVDRMCKLPLGAAFDFHAQGNPPSTGNRRVETERSHCALSPILGSIPRARLRKSFSELILRSRPKWRKPRPLRWAAPHQTRRVRTKMSSPDPAVHEKTFAEGLNEALREEMRNDPLVFVIGEDVGNMGGLFSVTKGLLDEFGPQRVIDAPISEAAIAGAGVGSALVGARPVIEFQFQDFMTIAMDQIVNHAAKLRYMSGGMVSIPLVVRAPVCTGVGLGAQHSQSLEAWFVHVPGLKVVMPSSPADAKGLLKSAIRDNNPVIFLESRMLYSQTGPIPEGEHLVPLGSASVKRPGIDVTVVATGRTVALALLAAEKLSQEGIEVEVIDPRTLKPLDSETILESLRKTNRLVVASDGSRTCGYAAELVAGVVEECFYELDAPPQRVCTRDVPMPAAPGLQKAIMVSEGDIILACRKALAA